MRLPLSSHGGFFEFSEVNFGLTMGGDMGVVLGVDPGKTGAVAVVEFSQSVPPSVIDMIDMPLFPNGKRIHHPAIAERLRPLAGVVSEAHLELVGVRPGNGAVGMFAFGHATGLILGILTGLGVRVYQHTPQQWKGLLGLLSASKRDSIVAASELFGVDASFFARHDQAEAALIAYAGIAIKRQADQKRKTNVGCKTV